MLRIPNLNLNLIWWIKCFYSSGGGRCGQLGGWRAATLEMSRIPKTRQNTMLLPTVGFTSCLKVCYYGWVRRTKTAHWASRTKRLNLSCPCADCEFLKAQSGENDDWFPFCTCPMKVVSSVPKLWPRVHCGIRITIAGYSILSKYLWYYHQRDIGLNSQSSFTKIIIRLRFTTR